MNGGGEVRGGDVNGWRCEWVGGDMRGRVKV